MQLLQKNFYSIVCLRLERITAELFIVLVLSFSLTVYHETARLQ